MMRSVCFIGICCATLALVTASPSRYKREEPLCLAYVTDTLTNAMRNIHAHYAGTHFGQPGGNYYEGTVRYAPDATHGNPDGFGFSGVRKAHNEGQKKTKRSASGDEVKSIDMYFGDMLSPWEESGYAMNRPPGLDEALEVQPIEMDFGDMAPIYDLTTERPPFIRKITCTEHVGGNDIVIELPALVETLMDIRNVFDRLFAK